MPNIKAIAFEYVHSLLKYELKKCNVNKINCACEQIFLKLIQFKILIIFQLYIYQL